jgi:hypothetical protein
MRLRACLVLCLAAVSLAAAACGSEEKSLVSRALDTPIHDADVAATLTIGEKGNPAVRASLAGPYHSNGPGRLESFDWKIGFAVNVAGESRKLAGRVISNGKNVFVVYRGVTYQVGERKIAAFTRRQNRESGKGPQVNSLADLEREGLDLEAWFPSSGVEDDARLDGVVVKHVNGQLDVSAAFKNIADLLDGQALGRTDNGKPLRLTPAIIARIDKFITDPRFDIYVGKEDGAFRRIQAQLGIRVKELSGGPDPANLLFRLDFSDVGQTKTIHAPSGGRPIAELLSRLQHDFIGEQQTAA